MFEQRVKSAYLYRDEGIFYMNIRYEVEDDDSIREVHIPKVRIPLENADLIMEESIDYDFDKFISGTKRTNDFYLDLKGGFLPCETSSACFPGSGLLDLKDVSYASRIIKDKTAPVEMTMDEIEKKLGHKVKIINKGE